MMGGIHKEGSHVSLIRYPLSLNLILSDYLPSNGVGSE